MTPWGPDLENKIILFYSVCLCLISHNITIAQKWTINLTASNDVFCR